MIRKEYLGDSVYVEYDGYSFILTTENGKPDDPSNTIILEPDGIIALKEYVDRVRRDNENG